MATVTRIQKGLTRKFDGCEVGVIGFPKGKALIRVDKREFRLDIGESILVAQTEFRETFVKFIGEQQGFALLQIRNKKKVTKRAKTRTRIRKNPSKRFAPSLD
jgi:hypothetical protein